MNKKEITLLDCTLRDGGYYNSWDFDIGLIHEYLYSVKAVGVDIVEIGFRSNSQNGFKGPCAFSTDDFIRKLPSPKGLKFGVMINASEIIEGGNYFEEALLNLFPQGTDRSPVYLVRVACHAHEFVEALKASEFLKSKGFKVGFNLMQIGEINSKELERLTKTVIKYPVDVLYFADSLGNLDPDGISNIVATLRQSWNGPLGIHTHDNMGFALANSLRAITENVEWIDSTIMGMGRGPGNTKTELLAIEIGSYRRKKYNISSVAGLISEYFEPLHLKYNWGTNIFYYLSAKYSIHPTYVQEMLADPLYSEDDILAGIEGLRSEGGSRFSKSQMLVAQQAYASEPQGTWAPSELFYGAEILLLGSGPSVVRHRDAIESYIKKVKPIVLALNTQSAVTENLIDYRVACHPVRIVADLEILVNKPQKLIVPASMLEKGTINSVKKGKLLDYGLSVQRHKIEYAEKHCIIPNSLVITYALAVASSGGASRVLLAGFDGYTPEDPRRGEIASILTAHQKAKDAVSLVAVTETPYELNSTSIYAI